MSLNEVVKALGSGQVLNVVNVLQSVVHAVIAEFDQLRGEHDQKATSTLEAVNRLEDRTVQAISGRCTELQRELEAGLEDVDERMSLLDQSVQAQLEANVTTTVEDVGQVEDRLGKLIEDLQATVKTHVERLEAAIAQLAPIGDKAGKLEGYDEPKKE
jgi:flagellar biosynthesis/type III secretory pathway protein FliH